MKYYKIILNNTIMGVSTSCDCLKFQMKHSMLERAIDEDAEYIRCANHLYHAQWMQTVKTNLYLYDVAEVISIEEQEYNILAPATETDPEIVIPPATNPIDEITLEYVREAKITKMSNTCRAIIEGGFDLELRDKVQHFSLTTQDQLNLISLSAMAQTQSLIPYHADGEECIFYTNEEINEIVETATAFKIYHTTYYNALKGYVNSLESIEEIAAIEYGSEIPEEYKSDVLKALEV